MKKKIHHDEELNRDFHLPYFEMDEIRTADDLIQKYPMETCTALLDSLILGINEKLTHVPFLMIGEAVLYSEKFEYLEKLDFCLQFFLDREEYEKCSKIVELKKKFTDLEYQLDIFSKT